MKSSIPRILITMSVVLPPVAGCTTPGTVCDNAYEVSQVCDWIPAPLDTCEDNLGSCTGDDLGRWSTTTSAWNNTALTATTRRAQETPAANC